MRTSATPRVVRPGGTITFTTTVTNDAVTVRREVTICDRMPASVAHVVHTDGASIFDANACRGPAPLAPDATSVPRLVVKLLRQARPGPRHNTVEILDQTFPEPHASAVFQVKPT